MKKLTLGLVSLASLCAVLMLTPLGATAQQTIRNVQITGDHLTSTQAIEAATEASQSLLDQIRTAMSTDATQGGAVIANGPQGMYEAKDQDGAALPNTVTEGQSIRMAGSMSGVGYVMLTNEDGSAVGTVNAAQNGAWTVQPGNTANTTPWLVTSAASASGNGCTPGSSISAGAVLETEIKGSAGQLYQLVVTNIDATPVFAKLYNDTAANTDETDTPIQRFVVPAQSDAGGGGFALPIPIGMVFSTAITIRVTTGAADNSTGALTANEVLVSYCFK